MVTLYQAEWCPFSSAVRERLTELGLDVLLRQVEPWPEQREALQAATGRDEIPALVPDDGEPLVGQDAILGWLAGRHGPHEAEHRRRWDEHVAEGRDEVTGKVLRHGAPLE